MNKVISEKTRLSGVFTVPGDKSISHRAVMFGAISKGITEIEGFLMGEDCLSTIDCVKKLGIDIDIKDNKVIIYGKGLHGLKPPSQTLDVGNSGTTMRLITGLLAAQPFECVLTGDASIQNRPMDRVITPLALMCADIEGLGEQKTKAPLKIRGKRLEGMEYRLPVASAQVKSAIILAGLYACSQTKIIEPEPTRDHTEILLNYLGADIKKSGDTIICNPPEELTAKNIVVPGDISSAAYFIAAGLICENSSLTIENICVNSTRTGIITALKTMRGNIEIINKRVVCGEEIADITVKSSDLRATVIEGPIIPSLIDEIPILAVAACFAKGTTIIKDAQELKVKESNRIKTITEVLKKLGADIEETNDGMIIKGGSNLHGSAVESHNDHRIAMCAAIAALKCDSPVTIENSECVDISFPGFFDLLNKL